MGEDEDQTYKTVKIGEQIWMAENKSYNVEGSECYDDDEANCNIYGRLYDWDMAQLVCPSGWHLPSIFEWAKLIDSIGGTNDHGFVSEDGYWWSSTAINDTTAEAIHIQNNVKSIRKSQVDKAYLLSVRCINNFDSYKEAQRKSNIAAAIFFAWIIIIIGASLFYKMEFKRIEAQMNENDFTIRKPKLDFIVIITSVAMIAMMIFLPLLLLCPIAINLWLRWRITVKNNQITYTPYFGEEKSFTLDYITEVKTRVRHYRGNSETLIYAYHNTEKLFSVSEKSPGYNILVSRLEEQINRL